MQQYEFNAWESLTRYDEQLRDISHYQVHPEMLPFVGKHYPNTRILLVGESHYLESCDTSKLSKPEDWYHTPFEAYQFDYPGNFNTRYVIHNYLVKHRSKGHSMFRNPAKSLIEAWNLNNVDDSEAFCAFAYMNYFQRPEAKTGQSIDAKAIDKSVALETFCRVVDILKPRMIVVLSQKSYEAYFLGEKNSDFQIVEYTAHPTCSFWHGPDGTQKLKRLLQQMPVYDGFSPVKHLSEEIMTVWLEKYFGNREEYPIVKKKRFFPNGVISIQVYKQSKESEEISSIVWRLDTGAQKLGIGYEVPIGWLWYWNYYTEKYMSEEELQIYPALQNLKEKVCEALADS